MYPVWPERSLDTLPWFKTINIGASTAYHAKKHIATIKKVLNEFGSFDKRNDIVLLVFGEVDIRMHVYIQVAKQKRSMEDIVNEIADRYLAAVSILLSEKFNIALYGCIASWIRLDDGENRTMYGAIKQRNGATRLFNDRLISFCKEQCIPYISIFEEMLLDNDETDLRYLDTNFMGNGNGLHATTKILPLLLWKCRDIGLISFDTAFFPFEAGNYFLKGG
jgi:hypothetical protein